MAIDPWDQHSGVLIVRAADVATLSDDLDDLVQRLKDSGDRTSVVVDLAPLDHINSSNLSQLVEAAALARQVNGKLCVAGVTENVRATFAVTKLDQVLTLHDHVALALADVASPD